MPSALWRARCKNERTRFYEQQFYAGIDLHARSMFTHILDHAGQTVFERDLPVLARRSMATHRLSSTLTLHVGSLGKNMPPRNARRLALPASSTPEVSGAQCFSFSSKERKKETMPSLPGNRQRPDLVELFGAALVFLPISGTPGHEPSRRRRRRLPDVRKKNRLHGW